VVAPVEHANVYERRSRCPEQRAQGWGHSHVRAFMATSGPLVYLGHILPVDVVMALDDDRCLQSFR
jgi:hypothetical protein